ncbi:hypothetical protein [Tateyamaria sp.]|uniref:hypothetical protein n=1 Tax=Tateyamaria sp. TaxID=1929288 RepID=UPI00329D91CC
MNIQSGFTAFMQKNWKIPLFYRFLQISPTYRMSYLSVFEQGPDPDCYDVVRMLNTAERFGNVWDLSFQDWWFKNGQHWLDAFPLNNPKVAAEIYGLSVASIDEWDLHHQKQLRQFYQQLDVHIAEEYMSKGAPDTLMLAVPMNGDHAEIERRLVALLRKQLKKIPETVRRKQRLQFLTNKIRQQTLKIYLYAVYCRAQGFPEKKLGRLAKRLEGKYPTDLFPNIALGPDDQREKDRRLEIQTSERLRKALYVSEWAAVGEFPRNKKHDRIRNNKYDLVLDDRLDEAVKENSDDNKELTKGQRKLKILGDYGLEFDWSFIQKQISAGKIDPDPDK